MFSIITVSYNSYVHVENLLNVLETRFAPWIREMVVWENGGQDLSLCTSSFRLRVVRSPTNIGFAKGVNRAYRYLEAKDTHLLLMNPDAYPLSLNFFSVMDEVLRRRDVGAVSPLVLYPDGTPQETVKSDRTAFQEIFLARTSVFSWLCSPRSPMLSEGEVEVITGAVMGIRRDAFEELGGLDERFFLFYEDHDFSRRLRLKGWKLCFLPQIQAVHQQGGSRSRRALWSQFQKIKSGVLFAKKWESWPPGLLESGLALGAGLYGLLDFMGITFMKEKKHWNGKKRSNVPLTKSIA